MTIQETQQDDSAKFGSLFLDEFNIVTAAGWKLFYSDQSITLNESSGEFTSVWFAVHPLTGAVFAFETDEGPEDLVLSPIFAAAACLVHLQERE